MLQQVHDPHHFNIAWTIALLAQGKSSGKDTFDHTVWIEAESDRTIFHASNGGCYVRVSIPTKKPGDPDGWRHIVYDPAKQIKDISAKGRKASPNQQDFDIMASTVHIFADDTPHLTFVLDDSVADSKMTATLPLVDVDWPYEVIAIFDRHETDPTATMAWPPMSAAFVNGVGKIVGQAIPVRLNSLVAAFDLPHPDVPEIQISGCAATKAT